MMNTPIPRHKVVIVSHVSIKSESEVSITVLYLLYLPHYTAVRMQNQSESTSVITFSHYEKHDDVRAPGII